MCPIRKGRRAKKVKEQVNKELMSLQEGKEEAERKKENQNGRRKTNEQSSMLIRFHVYLFKRKELRRLRLARQRR